MPDKRNKVAYVFLTVGLLVQILTYLLAPDNLWSLCSGCLGICSVVLCSEGKIATFFFGFAQILTYTYICFISQLYSSICLNIFYFLSQIYGIYVWRKRITSTGTNTLSSSVPTRRLPMWVGLCILGGVVALSSLVGFLLARYSSDSQPYLDAFSTVPAVAAQILMILAYREQWIGWLLIDILSIAMWAVLGNWCMVAQYAFWCANCIYGYHRWSKSLVRL